jgi:hypothetical protein
MLQLPNIIDEAFKRGLVVNPKTLSKKEVRFFCPFCNVTVSHDGKRKKYHLSVSQVKNTFRCFYCGEHGGALKFIALLDGVSETEVKERLKEEQGLTDRKNTKAKHPAETIPLRRLEELFRFMGEENRYLEGIQKYRFYLKLPYSEPARKDYLNYIWQEWNRYLDHKRRWLLIGLIISIQSGYRYAEMIEEIRLASQKYGQDFLHEILAAYTNPPKWAEGAFITAGYFHKNLPQPSEEKRMAVAL